MAEALKITARMMLLAIRIRLSLCIENNIRSNCELRFANLQKGGPASLLKFAIRISQFEIRNSRLVPEVFLSSADVIPGILGADQDAMPFTIFERMRRVVADTVLVAQLGGDLVQNLLDFAAAILGPIAGQEP